METSFFSFKKYCFSIKIIVDFFSSNLIHHNIFSFIDDDKVVVVVEVGDIFFLLFGNLRG